MSCTHCLLSREAKHLICMTVSKWSYTFSQLLYHVLETAFAAKPPPYSKILELDRKIRDFYVPKYLRPDCDMTDEPGRFLVLKRWLALSHKEWGVQSSSRCCPRKT